MATDLLPTLESAVAMLRTFDRLLSGEEANRLDEIAAVAKRERKKRRATGMLLRYPVPEDLDLQLVVELENSELDVRRVTFARNGREVSDPAELLSESDYEQIREDAYEAAEQRDRDEDEARQYRVPRGLSGDEWSHEVMS